MAILMVFSLPMRYANWGRAKVLELIQYSGYLILIDSYFTNILKEISSNTCIFEV